jgi:vacuolar-type H+-ATPase catalytic subunit A/Vma1
VVTYHDMDVLRTAQSQARQTARLADASERLAAALERIATQMEGVPVEDDR